MKNIVILVLILISGFANSATGFDKLINFWSGTLCDMSNPANWEDPIEEGPDEHAQRYGYGSEADALDAIRQYIGDPSLRTVLRSEIDRRCPGIVDSETFEAMVGGLQAQYGVAASDDVEEPEAIEGEANALPAQCKYDNECPDICEANVMWKQGCNGRSNQCEKTFDTDCSTEMQTLAGLEFGSICSESSCVLDRSSVEKRRTLISDDVKSLLGARQSLNDLYQESAKNCLNGLADVTNKAIVEVALLAGSIGGQVANFLGQTSANKFFTGVTHTLAENVGQMIGELGESSPTGTTAAEFIGLNCGLEEAIPGEMDALQNQIKALQKTSRDLQSELIQDGLGR